VTRGIPEKMSA